MIVQPSKLNGSVFIPPSKSAAHRAVIAAALAHGTSVISNIDLSSDIKATIEACRALGCSISITEGSPYNTVSVEGGIKIEDTVEIHCAESGSTLRFLIPVACTVSGRKIFSGSGRLPYRPIDAYYDIFKKDSISHEKPENANLPLTIDGVLSGGEYVIDGSVSSQYITGLLMSLPLISKDSEVKVVNGFESKGYVDITLDVLKKSGIGITENGSEFYIKGGQQYKTLNYSVEGDYSQAAFFLVGGCISGDVCINGLDENSLQPDKAIVDILKRMGAYIEYTKDGLCAKKSMLHGTEVDVKQCPDLVPPIAVAAACAKGKTTITGAARLKIKESDRLTAVSSNLNSLGIKTDLRDDGMTIYGGSLKGGNVDSFNDHRIAMAFSIAALCAGGETTINGEHSINKSYPKFFEDYAMLGGRIK